MIDDITPDYHLRRYIWPLGIILVGLFFIFRPKKNNFKKLLYDDKNIDFVETKSDYSHSTDTNNYPNEDWVDATAVFGRIKKVIVSKI